MHNKVLALMPEIRRVSQAPATPEDRKKLFQDTKGIICHEFRHFVNIPLNIPSLLLCGEKKNGALTANILLHCAGSHRWLHAQGGKLLKSKKEGECVNVCMRHKGF